MTESEESKQLILNFLEGVKGYMDQEECKYKVAKLNFIIVNFSKNYILRSIGFFGQENNLLFIIDIPYYVNSIDFLDKHRRFKHFFQNNLKITSECKTKVIDFG